MFESMGVNNNRVPCAQDLHLGSVFIQLYAFEPYNDADTISVILVIII